MINRIQALREGMPAGMDAALITSGVSREYLLGFQSSAGVLVVTDKSARFIIDSRYFEAARETVKDCEVVQQDKLYGQLSEILKKSGVKTVGLEADKVSLTKYLELKKKLEGFEVLESDFISGRLAKQRSVKDDGEIASIQASQDIADKTFEHILEYIRPGVSELDIAVEMELYARKAGSEGTAFGYIVAAGANSSRPHAVPSGYRVKNGDFVVLDFGCVKNGYRSDMTRTVAVGSASVKQREAYEIVLKAQQTALDAIRAGACCLDIDKLARDVIDATEYKGLFGHGLGHSLGLEIHEEPRFNKECETILEAGMCISVEPGIYIPGKFGVRIEDIVAVSENGLHNFCKSDKSLIVI